MLVSQGAEEEKVEKSHDDVTVIAKALRNARNSMLMYAHNPVMLPPHLPAPQMVLKDMEVAVFRPGEVAGGLAQMHKSSSVGNLKTSSIQQPVRLNPAQNRAAKVVPSTSSSVAGSSYGNDGQWSFNSDSAPPPAVSSSGADDEGWQWLFNDSSLNDQATTAGREQEHQLFRNSSSSRSSNNHGDRNSNNYLSNHSAAVHAGSVFSACMTEEDMFVWGFPISTKPTTTPGRPAADSENWLSAGTRSIGASSSATARASLSSASSSTAATSQQRSAAWMKTRDVEIVDLLDDSPLKPVPVHRPASPSSAPQLCDRMPPAVALPPPLPRAAPATSSMNSCAAVWNHANLSTSQQLPRLLGSQCQQQPGSQLQSQSQKLGASQVASQGAIRFKSLVRSTSRSVSFFTLSDDDTDDDDIDVGGNGVEPSQSPVVEVSKVAAKDINVSSRAANVAPQLNSPVSLPTSVTAPVDAPAPMQDSPLSQVLPPVRKKTARIADTQENFDSQCSVSDPENANDSEQQTSVRINGCVSSSARSSAAFDPFQQDSGELTAASEDDSESEEGGAREADDVEGGGDEEDEWRDTANACCACLDWRSEEEDPIIFCDGLCGSCIHVSCYGLLRDGVPEGDFFCESCAELKSIQEGTAASSSFSSFSSSAGSRKNHGPRKPVCGLCYRAGGLMKRGTCGTWTHPVCVLFTPELTICPRVNRPDNLANLSKDRKYLCCEQCRQHGGACVQCAVPECLKAVHPYCAYGARQQMILRIDERTEASSYELFCPKHKERYAVGPGSGEIVSSRISLVEDKISRAKKDKNCSNKALLQAKIGIADDAPRGRLLVQSSTSRSNLKSGVTFVSTTPKATGKAVRFGTSDSSPGDLVDTAEKPPQDSKKR